MAMKMAQKTKMEDKKAAAMEMFAKNEEAMADFDLSESDSDNPIGK